MSVVRRLCSRDIQKGKLMTDLAEHRVSSLVLLNYDHYRLDPTKIQSHDPISTITLALSSVFPVNDGPEHKIKREKDIISS